MENQVNQSNNNYNSWSETATTSGGDSGGIGALTSTMVDGTILKDEEECVEITLDVRDDSVLVQKYNSETATQIDRNTSSTTQLLKGLEFMTQRNVRYGGWPQIEKRFHELAVFGILSKSHFGQCIGRCNVIDFFCLVGEKMGKKVKGVCFALFSLSKILWSK